MPCVKQFDQALSLSYCVVAANDLKFTCLVLPRSEELLFLVDFPLFDHLFEEFASKADFCKSCECHPLVDHVSRLVNLM